jgi:hypothetical protein
MIFESFTNYYLRLYVVKRNIQPGDIVATGYNYDLKNPYVNSQFIYKVIDIRNDEEVVCMKGNFKSTFNKKDIVILKPCIVQYGVYDVSFYFNNDRTLQSIINNEEYLIKDSEVNYKKYFRIVEFPNKLSCHLLNTILITNVVYDGYRIQNRDILSFRLNTSNYKNANKILNTGDTGSED